MSRSPEKMAQKPKVIIAGLDEELVGIVKDLITFSYRDSKPDFFSAETEPQLEALIRRGEANVLVAGPALEHGKVPTALARIDRGDLGPPIPTLMIRETRAGNKPPDLSVYNSVVEVVDIPPFNVQRFAEAFENTLKGVPLRK